VGQLAYIQPIEMPGAPGTPTHPIAGAPALPTHPIELPPTPPGTAPEHPIALPPSGAEPSFPIVLPGTPEHPIALPPGTIWPPLDPSDGVSGKVCLLVWIVGTKRYRWVVVDVGAGPEHPWVPPTGGKPQPK
jgi:hypothetical protein